MSSGIPPQVVMKWTGHFDCQAINPYIAIAEKTKADAMKLFDQYDAILDFCRKHMFLSGTMD